MRFATCFLTFALFTASGAYAQQPQSPNPGDIPKDTSNQRSPDTQQEQHADASAQGQTGTTQSASKTKKSRHHHKGTANTSDTGSTPK